MSNPNDTPVNDLDTIQKRFEQMKQQNRQTRRHQVGERVDMATVKDAAFAPPIRKSAPLPGEWLEMQREVAKLLPARPTGSLPPVRKVSEMTEMTEAKEPKASKKRAKTPEMLEKEALRLDKVGLKIAKEADRKAKAELPMKLREEAIARALEDKSTLTADRTYIDDSSLENEGSFILGILLEGGGRIILKGETVPYLTLQARQILLYSNPRGGNAVRAAIVNAAGETVAKLSRRELLENAKERRGTAVTLKHEVKINPEGLDEPCLIAKKQLDGSIVMVEGSLLQRVEKHAKKPVVMTGGAVTMARKDYASSDQTKIFKAQRAY